MANSKPLSIAATQAQTALPADFRNDLYSALLSDTGIRNIEATLEHEMQTSGFKATLRAYITHLLRSGECANFTQVIARVNEKIRLDTHAAKANGTNGVNGVNGHTKDSDDYDLRLPEKIVQEGTKTVTAELEKVCDVTVER